MDLTGQIQGGVGWAVVSQEGPYCGNKGHPTGSQGISCISDVWAEIAALLLFLMNFPSSLCVCVCVCQCF